jgi:hypothetical protein
MEGLGQAGEGCEPKPAALVAGSDPRWEGSGRSGEGWIARLCATWGHRFNAHQGPDGLFDNWTQGPPPPDQLAELASIVETGPQVESDGVVRWRRVDLKRVISARFCVDYHERSVGKLLSFSHMSARPRHPAQNDSRGF